ncbi:MAG: hypothetical protein ABIO17_08570 [Pseudoxanthomonas sp.]
MKKSLVISLITAVVAFFVLCFVFSGKPDNAGLLASLDPMEAVMGLSFALSFAAGLPTTAAVIVSIAVLASVPAAVFLIARRFLRRFDG